MPRVSQGTIYRNLGPLAAQGIVRRISFGASVDRWEANTASHHHFVCDRCGAVADLDTPVDEGVTGSLGRAAGVNAVRHEIRLYGTCARCARGR